MTSSEIKEKFLEFFKERGHKDLASSSLLPENDPSVLFTTAGMQQFKRYYLFPDEAPAVRIVTCQKCLRTGDIDEVGDESHLTFFEMSGNFSFGYPKKEGSYFKEEAIKFAWEFLTDELKIDKSRIQANYFVGNDEISEDKKSAEILEKIDGLKEIKPTDFSETFWSLGTEGSPGGPTVEFHIDGVEVWNCVFNQYVLRGGKYIESELKGVDTGMGLERLSLIMQNKADIFETDVFVPIISEIEKISGRSYSENKKEFRIIADHIRSAVALISDGVIPSNKDQGYVLRRLIRRAIVKGKRIGIEENFTAGLIKSVCHSEAEAEESQRSFTGVRYDIKKELEKEENKFRKTIESGLKIIESQKDFSGKFLFDLYQTYGIPVEIAVEEIRNQNKTINHELVLSDEIKVTDEVTVLMKKHQELSRTASAGMFKGGLADNKVETTRLHTAAHLLLAALRQVLSSDVNQKGSNITEKRLRFDFNWPEKSTPEQITEVENIVNEKIKENIPLEMEELSLEEAKKSGATGIFNDRYGEKVKVYSIDGTRSTHSVRSGSRDTFVSREICGGPHVKSTGELGKFKIVKEESSSAGIRRIKAVLE